MKIESKPSRRRHRMQFWLAIFSFAFVWLVALPWLGQATLMRGMIERNQAGSIDPGAMFYTDIEHLSYDRGILRRERKNP